MQNKVKFELFRMFFRHALIQTFSFVAYLIKTTFRIPIL